MGYRKATYSPVATQPSPMPEIYEFPEAEGIAYAIRLVANRVFLYRLGVRLSARGGRPHQEVCRCFANYGYRAESWKNLPVS
jgi:hypothetical protein